MHNWVHQCGTAAFQTYGVWSVDDIDDDDYDIALGNCRSHRITFMRCEKSKRIFSQLTLIESCDISTGVIRLSADNR